MSVLDIISQNYKQSPLGQGIDSLPTDNRTPQQKMSDLIANDPNTPAPVDPTPTPTPITPVSPTPIAAPVATNGQAPLMPGQLESSQQPFVAATGTRTPGSTELPSAYKNFLGSYDQEKKDTNSLGAAQAGVYNSQAAGLENEAAIQNQAAATLKAKQDELKGHLAPVEKVSSDLNDQIQNNKIDPNHFYASRSTGDKILTGIGLALSAFGGPQAVQGSIKIIDDAIDRDVNNQKLQYEQLKDKKAQNDSIYGKLRQEGLDDQQASMAAYTIMLDQAKTKTNAIVARSNSPVALANSRLIGDQIEQKKQMAGISIAQLASQPKFGDTLQPGYRPIGADVDRYVPGYGLARNKEEAAKLSDEAGLINPIMSSLKSLKDIYGTNPNEVKIPADAERARAQTIIDKLTTQTAQMNGVKRYNEDFYKFLKDQGSDVTAWKPNQMAKFKQLLQSTAQEIKGKVSARMSNYDPQFGATLGDLVK